MVRWSHGVGRTSSQSASDGGTIFLLPPVPVGPEIADGRTPAGACPSCDGLVVALDAATDRLTELVVGIRRTGSLHFATLLSLTDSWAVAPPDSAAVLAELSVVAPEVLAVFGLDDSPVGVRLAIGAFLLVTLPSLLSDAGLARYDAEVAARGAVEAVAAPPALSVVRPA